MPVRLGPNRRISRLDLLGERGLPSGSIILPTVELKDIKAIIDLMRKNDLSVFEMEKDGFRLKLQKGPGDQPVISVPATLASAATPTTAPNGPPASLPAAAETAPLKDIVSPMVGTFYQAGSPDAPPFVDVGKTVDEDTVVC